MTTIDSLSDLVCPVAIIFGMVMWAIKIIKSVVANIKSSPTSTQTTTGKNHYSSDDYNSDSIFSSRVEPEMSDADLERYFEDKEEKWENSFIKAFIDGLRE